MIAPDTPDVAPPAPFPELPPPAPRPPRRRWLPRSRRWRLILLTALLLVAALAARLALPPSPPAVPAVSATPAPRLIARATLQPIKQAKIRTLAGGVVTQLTAEVGQPVQEAQEVARTQPPGNGPTEVLTAPWSGRVSDVLIHLGDTVTAGSVIATVADLSRLQAETQDVDEFLIASIHPGQHVTMTVDAVDGLVLAGTVRTVALQTQTSATGDETYPVVIDLAAQARELRAGMTVRVNFQP